MELADIADVVVGQEPSNHGTDPTGYLARNPNPGAAAPDTGRLPCYNLAMTATPQHLAEHHDDSRNHPY
jgi:hypothetical protein